VIRIGFIDRDSFLDAVGQIGRDDEPIAVQVPANDTEYILASRCVVKEYAIVFLAHPNIARVLQGVRYGIF
jgi:hypothetical protein